MSMKYYNCTDCLAKWRIELIAPPPEDAPHEINWCPICDGQIEEAPPPPSEPPPAAA